MFGRIVAQNMAAQWNNASIVFESKSGANGSIAAEDVARSAPDGYTWLIVTSLLHREPGALQGTALGPAARFRRRRRDLPGAERLHRAVQPAGEERRRVRRARQVEAGDLTYGHPGKGSTGHLGFELFKKTAGIDVTGVGYRGYPQMVPDIASGLVKSCFFSVNQALGQVQSGAVRIIGTINDGRTKYFPDAPTMAEQGFPDAQVTPWFGIAVPKGTPQAIVERIDKALEAALAIERGAREARHRRLRGQERAAVGLCRHHQVGHGAVGESGQGGRNYRGLVGFFPHCV